ncbi:MAG TPA: hypothetical protein VGG57_07350 [Stellaceae bacterium]
MRRDLDGFLFAQVGNEIDGMPLSVISALARLDLDPWEEAGRLSSFSKVEAAEQLARLIADLPNHTVPLADARKIAAGLVALLPRNAGAVKAPQHQIRPPRRIPSGLWPPAFLRAFLSPSQLWIACVVIAGAALISAVIHHGLPFGIGNL